VKIHGELSLEAGAASSGAQPAPELSVLLVTYRTRERTLACLQSIYQQTQETRFQVVVVDNDSQDGSTEAIARGFPDVTLLSLPANIGYARAINLAAQSARGDYLVLLNPDTEVLHGALDKLLAFARAHPGHGLYTGKTVRPSGELDPRSCWGAPSLWSLTCFGLGLSTLFRSSPVFNPESLGRWRRDTVREVPVVTGCLCLVPRPVWDELGGFDPIYFVYGEDTDLSLRAARRGYRPLFTPDATIMHVGSASSARDIDKTMLLMQGKATFARRHWSGVRRTFALAMLAMGVGLRGIVAPGSLRNGHRRTWAELWRRRRQWLAGYQPMSDPPSG
jgi:GT2 family glycosyltransferase